MKSSRLLIFCLLLAACVQPKPAIVMDENRAIAAANGFLKAVMQSDYHAAYAFISPGLKYNPQMRFEQFTADWDAIQSKYGPIRKAVLDTYQPVPGRRVMQLYYQVFQNSRAPIVYHLLVEADSADKYTLFLIDIGNAQPFPPGAAPTVTPLKKAEVIEVVK
jgi:hypothetical protein